jgi:hypothetical protein
VSKQSNETIGCHQYVGIHCFDAYPKGIKKFCQARKYAKAIWRVTKNYFRLELFKINVPSAKIMIIGNTLWLQIKGII